MLKLSGEISQKGPPPVPEESAAISGYKVPKMWVLVADSKQANIFHKRQHHLEKIGEIEPEPIADDRLQGSAGGGLMRGDAHNEVLRHHESLFMKELAEFLDVKATAHEFDRLVVILTPRMLGMLRMYLSTQVETRIITELHKDLTDLNEKQLYEYLDSTIHI